MIYLRLSGGLGNQLYQIAAASLISHSAVKPRGVIPLIDGLTKYKQPRQPDSIKILEINEWLLQPQSFNKNIWTRLAIDVRAGRWLPFWGISDRNFWKINLHNIKNNYILDGYFQHGWTQAKFSRALNKMPVAPISISAKNRIAINEVIIHIRGGDFLHLPRFQIVDAQFYIRAVHQAKEHGFNRFAVISDDPAYANTICSEIRRSVPRIDIRLIPQGETTLIDFDTLRSASARIIGNSTFAWWASAFGSKTSITWSPPMFAKGDYRDFFLSNERQVACFT
jgi:hypothetical protein